MGLEDCKHLEDGRCRDGFSDSAYCGACTGRTGESPPSQSLISGPSMTANFDSDCAHCGVQVVAGEEIAYSNEAGGWIKVAHGRRLEMPL